MSALALGNVGSTMAPVAQLRHICFCIMHSHSLVGWLVFFISLSICWPYLEKKGVRLKAVNSLTSKMESDSLSHTITPTHQPTLPSPGTEHKPNTYFFPSLPVWESVKEKTHLHLSPHTYSQCLANCGLAGLVPRLAGFYLPPFSHTCPFPHSLPICREHTEIQTHFFFTHASILIINTELHHLVQFDLCVKDHFSRMFSREAACV